MQTFQKKTENFRTCFHRGGSNEYPQPMCESRKKIDVVLTSTFNTCFRAEKKRKKKTIYNPANPNFYVKSS